MAEDGFECQPGRGLPLPQSGNGGAGGGRVIEVQRVPEAEGVHVLQEGVGGAVFQFQAGGVGYGVVEAAVGQHVAQVVHVDEGGPAGGDALLRQGVGQFEQGVAAEVGEEEQAVGLQRARPACKNGHGIVFGGETEVAPQHVGRGFGQGGGEGLAVLGDGFPRQFGQQAAAAFVGRVAQAFGAGVVFGKGRFGVAGGKQAAAVVAVGTGQEDAAGDGFDDLQPLVGLFGKVAVDLPAVVGHAGFSFNVWRAVCPIMTSNTVNSNEDAPYRHARAGGNPNRRITALSYPFLKTQTLDSRLRGQDDGGYFLF